MNKKNDFSQKMHSYLRHPASLIMMILVKLAALITFTVLIFFNRIYSGTWCTVPETVVILFTL